MAHGGLVLAGLMHGAGPEGLGIEGAGDGGGHTTAEEVEGAVLGHAHMQLNPGAKGRRVGLTRVAVALASRAGASDAGRPSLVALDFSYPRRRIQN